MLIGATKMSVQVFERLKHLNTLGYNSAEIHEVLSHEFRDIEINPLSLNCIKSVISENREELEKDKLEMSIRCKEIRMKNGEMLFNKASEQENRTVTVFIKKMNTVLIQLEDLDLEERDDLGNFKNTSRFFVLIEMVDKLQSKISKIVGTDAMREIEIYRHKMELKQKAEESLLVPGYGKPVNGREVSSSPTSFVS